ncbi:MAG: NfeD family protein [Bacteroidales bacterium]|nr:NfeD family protein [Bacteroidales bacterium]
MKKTLYLLAALLCLSHCLPAQERTKTVYYFHIDEEIAPPASLRVENAMEEAEKIKADIVVVHLNTFGGTLNDADKIRTAFLQSKVPVWAFVDNNAASAGALIAIACDSIYMHSGSSIGAATVVNGTGEVQPDKYQSYMRSMMRATAEANGRRPDIAEAMVDPDVRVPGIVDSGKVLTFTTAEAITHGYCEAQVGSLQELLKHAGVKQYVVREQRYTAIQKFIGFLVSPFVSGLLIMCIIGGIYFELQSPGIGFPLLLALLAAALYFAPLYLEGLADHWEIAVFFVGLVLLVLELFFFPGFGVSGVSGIILMVAGLTLSMVDNVGFDFSHVPTLVIGERFVIVIMAVMVALPLSIWLGKKFFESKALGGLALHEVQDTNQGYTVAETSMADLKGQQGTAATILRPAGKVDIGGKIYDAVALVAYIDKGTPIYVVGYENQNLVVKKAE